MSASGRQASSRGFEILDAMILVATVAVGLGAIRGWVVLRSRMPQLDAGNLPARMQGFRDAHTATRIALATLSMAIAPLNLRRVVPVGGRRWGSPGTVVPVAVGLSILATAFDEMGFPFLIGFYYLFSSGEQRLFQVVTEAIGFSRSASAVAIAWAALAVSGSWRREAHWVGWLGLATGIAWIGACVGYRAYELAIYWIYGQVVV